MSMDRCGGCDRPIDTDFDMDCYLSADDPNKPWCWDGDHHKDYIVRCENCREEMGVTLE